MGTSKLLWRQPDKMLGGNLRWTSIPSRGNRNTSSRFILQKPPAVMSLLARPISIVGRLCCEQEMGLLHTMCNVKLYSRMEPAGSNEAAVSRSAAQRLY